MTPLYRIFDQGLLLVIGAMKAGTSSLHRYLDLHPDIAMSGKKELDYFLGEKNWRRGKLWYASQLRWGTSRYIGESSPNYSKAHLHPGVAQRIYAAEPNARLIFSARDPLARAVSHYLHNVVNGREWRSMDEALDPTPGNHYLETSPAYSRDQVEFSELELRQLFERAGLSVDISPQGVLSTPFAETRLLPEPIWQPLARVATALDPWLEARLEGAWVRRLAWNLVAVAQPKRATRSRG